MPFPFSDGDVLQADEMNAMERTPWVWIFHSAFPIPLLLTHESKVLRVLSSSPQTLQIPTEVTRKFEVGAQMLVHRSNTGAVTISRSTGVSLFGVNGNQDYIIPMQHGFATLLYAGNDDWYIMGDVA